MESKGGNPLDNYRKIVPNDLSTFTFEKINMAQLHHTLKRMKTTGSMGEDDLSINTITQVQRELEPLILHMVNRSISTTTFPTQLKTTKIVPIQKAGKETTTADGWRPVNVVGALSKIIEKVFLTQILKHLDKNNLISHQHHRSDTSQPNP